MFGVRTLGAAFAAASLLLALPSGAAPHGLNSGAAAKRQAPTIEVTIDSKSGPRIFKVEVARTPEQQERGLMYRTNLPADGGMIFIPYPADGGPPREASFWMKNTPSSLDIIFIRPDGTIATIAANAEPFSETSLRSGEPVSAVLEINAGKAAELGIAPGDKVRWRDK